MKRLNKKRKEEYSKMKILRGVSLSFRNMPAALNLIKLLFLELRCLGIFQEKIDYFQP